MIWGEENEEREMWGKEEIRGYIWGEKIEELGKKGKGRNAEK